MPSRVAAAVALCVCSPLLVLGCMGGHWEITDSPPSAPASPPPAPLEIGEVVRAQSPPPPTRGGTLITTRLDGAELLVASDPDNDRVYVVDSAAALSLRHDVALVPGDEPWRLAADASGRVHVTLRGTGELATIDLALGRVVARRQVCAEPRGVAYDAPRDLLYVACEGGELVSFTPNGMTPVRVVRLDRDLRDVVVANGRLFVTRFRSAQLLVLRDDGTIEGRVEPPTVQVNRNIAGTPTTMTFAPALAWRAIATDDGRVVVVHQRAQREPVVPTPAAPVEYYGSQECTGGIVHTALMAVDANAPERVRTSQPLVGAVLPVDIAISPDSGRLAVASAAVVTDGGGFSARTPTSSLIVDASSSFLLDSREVLDGCSAATAQLDAGAETVAVAFLSDGVGVTLTRNPTMLQRIGGYGELVLAPAVADTGHQLFHMDAGGGLACASCHAEGQDDGLVWTFALGPRRTQSVSGGILETAPFHWSGDMTTLGKLMNEVFVTRMGGGVPSDQHVAALASWLDRVPAPRASAAADPTAIDRGRALFQSSDVGCATCHSGSRLTNNATVDVGTGEALQVPSLVGVAARGPFLHDGCAPTLRDRFGACGGGDRHGHTSHLTDAQLGDLVAYLESL